MPSLYDLISSGGRRQMKKEKFSHMYILQSLSFDESVPGFAPIDDPLLRDLNDDIISSSCLRNNSFSFSEDCLKAVSALNASFKFLSVNDSELMRSLFALFNLKISALERLYSSRVDSLDE